MEPNDCLPADIAKLAQAAEVLKAVAHPVRLRIIELLEDGEKTVTELLTCLGTQQAYTSQQLNILKSKGVVAARRQGNQIYYSVANPGAIKVIHCIRGTQVQQQQEISMVGGGEQAGRIRPLR
jgi:DNA-binding transcriptional ArsR family regulator